MHRLTNIRPALPYEAAQLTALALQAKAHWGYPESALHAWAADLSITEDHVRTQTVCVAEYEGGLVGFYLLSARAELDHLWVSPVFMGRGFGRELLEHGREAARAKGYEQLVIDADPHAEGFYLRCGAVRVGEVPAPIAGEPQRVRPQLVLNTGSQPSSEGSSGAQ